MKFDRSNKFHLCYYGQVNTLRLKSSVASKWALSIFGGNIYFAGVGIERDNFSEIVLSTGIPLKIMRY